MPPSNITVVGSLNSDLVTVTDRLPGAGETLASRSFSMLPGGKGANAAVAAARLSHCKPLEPAEVPKQERASDDVDGIRVRMVGCVGNDQFGQPLIDAMRRNQVDASGIRVSEGATGVSVIVVEAELGQNRILFNPGANYHLKPDDFLSLESLKEGPAGAWPDLVVAQLEIRRETVAQVLATAGRAGVATLLNPAPASALPMEVYASVTHLILNETEAATLTGRREEDLGGVQAWQEVVYDFLRRGVQNAVLTLGEKGAFYASKDGSHGHVEAQKGVKVVDTTGAGYVSSTPAQSLLLTII